MIPRPIVSVPRTFREVLKPLPSGWQGRGGLGVMMQETRMLLRSALLITDAMRKLRPSRETPKPSAQARGQK